MTDTKVLPTRARSDPDRVVVAAAVAFLSTCVALSAYWSRARGDLDTSNFATGVLATVALLVAAVAGGVFGRRAGYGGPRSHLHADLVAWPGAFGALSAGVMVDVLLDDSRATVYVAGVVVLALAFAGYVVSRRDAFVLAAIVGGLAIYLQLASDVLDIGSDRHRGDIGITLGVLVFAFTVVVTAAGWVLPSRVLTGVVLGAGAVTAFALTLGYLLLTGLFEVALGPDGDPVRRFTAYDNDAWTILVLGLLLMAGWGVCAQLSNHVGFRVLMVAMGVTVVPLATVVLSVEHPTWWEVAAGVVGGGALVLAVVRALGGRTPASPAPPSYPAIPPPPPFPPPTSLAPTAYPPPPPPAMVVDSFAPQAPDASPELTQPIAPWRPRRDPPDDPVR